MTELLFATLEAIGGLLCIGSSSRRGIRCNIDWVGRCRAHCMCSLRRRSGDRDSCKLSFVLASLMNLRDERKEKGRLTKREKKGPSFERKSSLRF